MASDRETLAAELFPTYGRRALADKILASDLRERDRQVREATKAGIAEAIEAAYQEGRGWLSTIREEDADIAREWEPGGDS